MYNKIVFAGITASTLLAAVGTAYAQQPMGSLVNRPQTEVMFIEPGANPCTELKRHGFSHGLATGRSYKVCLRTTGEGGECWIVRPEINANTPITRTQHVYTCGGCEIEPATAIPWPVRTCVVTLGKFKDGKVILEPRLDCTTSTLKTPEPYAGTD